MVGLPLAAKTQQEFRTKQRKFRILFPAVAESPKAGNKDVALLL